ncbi:hypothetical protein SDC9_210299 [bioreactor metagenome]|uniref:Uncharacterized protein n=1 Tax=bioreactor metagenome TaxID=1076179 RepID=A0A645JHH2_9ZZZZ
MGTVHCHITGMVAKAFLLFERQVVFLIQNDQAQIGQRRING